MAAQNDSDRGVVVPFTHPGLEQRTQLGSAVRPFKTSRRGEASRAASRLSEHCQVTDTPRLFTRDSSLDLVDFVQDHIHQENSSILGFDTPNSLQQDKSKDISMPARTNDLQREEDMVELSNGLHRDFSITALTNCLERDQSQGREEVLALSNGLHKDISITALTFSLERGNSQPRGDSLRRDRSQRRGRSLQQDSSQRRGGSLGRVDSEIILECWNDGTLDDLVGDEGSFF